MSFVCGFINENMPSNDEVIEEYINLIRNIRQYTEEEIEKNNSRQSEYPIDKIDLNNTIWKDSIDAFNTFYKYFNNDKIDLSNSKDVVKSIIFVEWYCIVLSSVIIYPYKRHNNYAPPAALIDIYNCIQKILENNDWKVPPHDPFIYLIYNSNAEMYFLIYASSENQ